MLLQTSEAVAVVSSTDGKTVCALFRSSKRITPCRVSELYLMRERLPFTIRPVPCIRPPAMAAVVRRILQDGGLVRLIGFDASCRKFFFFMPPLTEPIEHLAADWVGFQGLRPRRIREYIRRAKHCSRISSDIWDEALKFADEEARYCFAFLEPESDFYCIKLFRDGMLCAMRDCLTGTLKEVREEMQRILDEFCSERSADGSEYAD